MEDLQFRCFSCSALSPMQLAAAGRDEVARFGHDANMPQDITFYCKSCGTANTIAFSAEAVRQLLTQLSSHDPQTKRAIADARRGDFSGAVDEVRRRFGF